MEYRMNGWSVLGFGCMRFPGRRGHADMEATRALLAYALDHGINYFDTAYIYPGNEKVLGKLMAENGWRDRMVIASKLPHYLFRDIDTLEKLFEEQLDRLQTDYIDNYLMHMLPDALIWEKLVRMGVPDWIRQKKESGQIRRIGFSYHGNTENFIRLIDAYPWDFCQVQYNYMDEGSQAGRKGVEYAASKGIPVIIMEPLRGGRLADGLPKEALRIFRDYDSVHGSGPDGRGGDRCDDKSAGEDRKGGTSPARRSPAEWGLRWLWDQESVAVILSGMNTMEMLAENVRIADEARPGMLSPGERQTYEAVKAAIRAGTRVPCTGCGYCQPCPKGVDIPGAFKAYNDCAGDGYFTGMREYLMCTTFRAEPANASRCVSCGQCEQHCPQHIAIRRELKEVTRHMESPVYCIIAWGSRFIFKKK